jgi:acyl dehydratase
MSDSEMGTHALPAQEIIELAGKFEGYSPWILVDQEQIDRFAEAIDDHQFIHVDPERARSETPFGGTIAHGFLTLSLLSTMIYQTLPRAREAVMGINYGFDKIRFLAPVPAGAKIRGVFRLNECDMRKPGELLSKYDVTVEIEGSQTPALVAEWYGLSFLSANGTGHSGNGG